MLVARKKMRPIVNTAAISAAVYWYSGVQFCMVPPYTDITLTPNNPSAHPLRPSIAEVEAGICEVCFSPENGEACVFMSPHPSPELLIVRRSRNGKLFPKTGNLFPRR